MDDLLEKQVKFKIEDLKRLCRGCVSLTFIQVVVFPDEFTSYFQIACQYFRQVRAESHLFDRAKFHIRSSLAIANIVSGKQDAAYKNLEKSIPFLDFLDIETDYYLVLLVANLYSLLDRYSQAEAWVDLAFRKLPIPDETVREAFRLMAQNDLMLIRGKCKDALKVERQYDSLKKCLDQRQIEVVKDMERATMAFRQRIKAQYALSTQSVLKTSEKDITALLLLMTAKTYLFQRHYLAGMEEDIPLNEKLFQGHLEACMESENTMRKRKDIVGQKINELADLAKNKDCSFLLKFYEYFPYFIDQLRSRAVVPLSSVELEVCAYTKLNFSTKGIALYRRDSIRSVENRKYRIRKKLDLRASDDFMVWVARIPLLPVD